MATPTPTTGTATPIELDPEQAAKSLKVSLADRAAKAAALYAHKNYEEAAEVYSQATEMQAEMNGEMSPENAEILFLYGRALFKVGQSKSDVLGGKAPDATKPKPKPKPAKKSKAANGGEEHKNGKKDEESAAPAPASAAEAKVDEVVAEVAKEVAKKEESSVETKKPLFHFEGDENFEDSEEEVEEEDDGNGEGQEEEEEEDDLAVAFEILDLARVLFNKRLETAAEPETDKGKEVSEGDSPTVRHIKERLADTHDLLAEISFEGERFPNAITDCRASLAYKKELYSEDSEIIAEAHFKLSLALEFASITKSSDDTTEGGDDKNVIDQTLRDEAATELEAAIASTQLKLQNKEVELATLHSPEDNEVTRQQIGEVKEMIADMEQRLVDLRKPPVDIQSELGLPFLPASASSAAAGGKDAEEVKKNANDLTGLVRKKRKAEDTSPEEGDAKKVKEGEGVN